MISKISAIILSLFIATTVLADDGGSLFIKQDSNSKIVGMFARDTASTAGASGLASIVTGGSLTCHYVRSNDGSAPTAITLTAGTKGTWSSGGWVAVDNSLIPGEYQLGLPNAALAAGADWVDVICRGFANMRPTRVHIDLIAFDLDTAVQNTNTVTNQDKTGYTLSSSQTFNTTGSVGSVTTPVTVGTNNDKNGYRLSGVKDTLDALNDVSTTDIWNTPLEKWPVVGSAGQYLDRVAHYIANAWTYDPKTKRYSVKKDDKQTEYESGISSTTERTPN